MRIDCHCHAGKGDGLTAPWDTRAPLSRYLRRAEEAQISRSVIFSVFHSDYSIANREIARIVERQPERFYGFAFVHALRDKGRVHKIVREAVEVLGLCGVKVHRHDARISREICDAAREYSLPVLYDVMDEVSALEFIAKEYPDVYFIIPHLGSFGDNWKAHVQLIDILCRHPNVYADSSGVRRFDYLDQAVKRAGAKKILFGTDGPWLHPQVELGKIYALKLSPEDEKLVLGCNFLNLIRRDHE